MANKILRYNSESFRCRQQMYLFGKFAFQFRLLRSINFASLFQNGSYFFVDFRILQLLQTFAAVFII